MAKSCAVILGLILGSNLGYSALISRTVTFEDGNILTASQLNSEFNNVVNGVNSIDNANIASGANIDPAKLSATIAGIAITRNAAGALAVGVDDSTIETNADLIRLKDSGITSAKILDGTIVNADIDTDTIEGTRLNANVADNSSIELSGDALQLKDDGTTQAKLAHRTVTTNGTDPGAGGISQSASSGVFQTGSAAYVLVTNQSTTLTTTGRPVMVMLAGVSGSESKIGCVFLASFYCESGFKLLRGATELSSSLVSFTRDLGSTNSQMWVPPSSMMVIDTPAAGTYTYHFHARSEGGVTLTDVSHTRIVAYEL
jgi:hypothetical protein